MPAAHDSFPLDSRLYRQAVLAARRLPGSGRHEDLEISKMVAVASLGCLATLRARPRRPGTALETSQRSRTYSSDSQALLRPAFLAAIETDLAQKLRLYLASLAVSLTDSQIWAIERGLLTLLAAPYKQSSLGEFSKASQRGDSPAFRCNLVLFSLLAFEPTAEKLRAHNALEGFRPHNQKINSAEVHPWSGFVKRLQGVVIPVANEYFENWKMTGDRYDGRFWIPVVCSWTLCAAGREPVVGKRFSSNEHQKLHWATHKVHCKADPAQN
ncbi:hypothetical protein KFL_001110080 [Klebsormidium nitens]|uniref:Uncharacterized protein n=1 Tax=Klebsormidium nitens TaxID=105231 RepID=A0A1Y1HZS8_KLENI|nr:hypothetical protein KFL_001110080 [Klebsormidium nitens]|eukprot:GAQ82431.1 hypothetical protein KFL_001110080 [Klebsormidium nitens]